MNDDSIQIEFSDAELEGAEVETQGVVDDKETQQTEETDKEVSKPETTVSDESGDDEAGETDKDKTAPSDNHESEENVVAKTDAELAVIHGVSEDEIKYARNMGWSPKEKFRGNPDDWKGPKEFIDIAEQSAPVLRDRLREMSKQVSEMKKTFPMILEIQKRELQNKVETLTSTNEQLQKELEEAHAFADSKRAADLTEKIFENKLKIALTKEEEKHVGEGNKTDSNVIVPDNIDVEREKAWRDSILPKLTLEQREIYNEAAKFVSLPQNADKTTSERIAFMEAKIFGRQSRPSVASVARPSTSDVASTKASVTNEYEGWDNLSAEEKKIAVSAIEETAWYQTRDTDPKSKAMWNEFKKQF